MNEEERRRTPKSKVQRRRRATRTEERSEPHAFLDGLAASSDGHGKETVTTASLPGAGHVDEIAL
jgi:hypothetical protein